MWDLSSLNRELNLCPLHWECEVQATGPPGKSCNLFKWVPGFTYCLFSGVLVSSIPHFLASLQFRNALLRWRAKKIGVVYPAFQQLLTWHVHPHPLLSPPSLNVTKNVFYYLNSFKSQLIKDFNLPPLTPAFGFVSLSGSSLHSSAGFFGFPPFPVRGFSADQSVSHSVLSDSFQLHGLEPAKLLCPWDSPGKNTGVGGHALLQGIFPTPGTEPGSTALLAQILYHLSHQRRWAVLIFCFRDSSLSGATFPFKSLNVRS